MSLALVVDNAPALEAIDFLGEIDCALLFVWLLGTEVDAAFELRAWSRILTANTNGDAR